MAAPKNVSLQFFGIGKWEQMLKQMFETAPDLLKECVTELGLFLEREIKANTPVDYGRLRASVGHYTPWDIRRPATSDEHLSGPQDAYFEVLAQKGQYIVRVGTNVSYAPYIEYGYSWPRDGKPRVVYLEYIKGKRVDSFFVLKPRTYPPQRMFEKGVLAAQRLVPTVVQGKWEKWVAMNSK